MYDQAQLNEVLHIVCQLFLFSKNQPVELRTELFLPFKSREKSHICDYPLFEIGILMKYKELSCIENMTNQ